MTHHRLSMIAATAASCLALLQAADARAGTIWNETLDGDLSGSFNWLGTDSRGVLLGPYEKIPIIAT